MSRNKEVYAVFLDGLMSEVDRVFSTRKSMNKYLNDLRSEILEFTKTNAVEVTIEKEKDEGVENLDIYSILSNIPQYSLRVLRTEISNSQNTKLSEIHKVWVFHCDFDPYEPFLFLTREEGVAYLQSIGVMDQNEKLRDDLHFGSFTVS